MVKLVTKITRNVAGRDLKPGDEFEVDEGTARVLVQSGHAEAPQEQPNKPAPAPAAPPAEPAKPAAAKAATEVKPVSMPQPEQPQQGEYATRDLKAKG